MTMPNIEQSCVLKRYCETDLIQSTNQWIMHLAQLMRKTITQRNMCGVGCHHLLSTCRMRNWSGHSLASKWINATKPPPSPLLTPSLSSSFGIGQDAWTRYLQHNINTIFTSRPNKPKPPSWLQDTENSYQYLCRYLRTAYATYVRNQYLYIAYMQSGT